jgi:tryptophan-rich sensory protein
MTFKNYKLMEMDEAVDRTLENSLWKRLWTSLKRDYVGVVMVMIMMMVVIVVVVVVAAAAATTTTMTTTTTN